MSGIRQIRDRISAHWELGHRALAAQDYEAGSDFLDGIEKGERELAAAMAAAHAEFTERAADPDAVSYQVPEGAPSNWVDAPGGRERLSPALSRRLAEAEAHEAFQSRQAERERAELSVARHEAAVTEAWRDAVATGEAGIGDLRDFMRGERGRTKGEAVAAAVAAQNQEDLAMRNAQERYGRAMLSRFGPSLTGAELERLLYGDREQS
jgi:hypothetical protein